MRVPLSWLREYVELPDGVTGRQVAEKLIRAGLEVETVDESDLTGPLVVGKVLSYEPEPQKNGKTIRWCSLDIGKDEPQWVVCGADNFEVGDLVVVVLPGAVLPGGFAISARKTYGHVSAGMICSSSELGLGDDGSGGIVVLQPGEGTPGDDAIELLGLRDDVLDIAVTPDRGYCLSIRGVAREAATAYGVELKDPAALTLTGEQQGGYPVRVDDAAACSVFVTRTVTGIDATAPSPRWLQQRLTAAGMRPISIGVDVTNYVMLELGQPIHGYDQARLSGDIVVRRANAGEKLMTLDDQTRELDAEDLLIVDDSGPIGIAGVMGGASTEISAATTDVVIEAAHFDPIVIARASRRHKLSSEASRRFERGADPALPRYAAQRVADLLAELAGGTILPDETVVDTHAQPTPVVFRADHAARVAGAPIPIEHTVRHLRSVGCTVATAPAGAKASAFAVGSEASTTFAGDPSGGEIEFAVSAAFAGGSLTAGAAGADQLTGTDLLTVTPPSWRPDLRDPNDFAEEVIRLFGYDNVPSVLPSAPGGQGLTVSQRRRRRIATALVGAGLSEVVSYPFVGEADFDAMGLAADDPRRSTVTLVNPLSDEEPSLQTTLLPTLLRTAERNVGRGSSDLAIFQTSLVFKPRRDAGPAPLPSVAQRPTDAEIDSLYAALPEQPLHLGAVLTGARTPTGWWGKAQPVTWADAVQVARTVAAAVGVEPVLRNVELAPWHPGRCAELSVGGTVIGHAGELHPKVCQAFGLPARSSAVELDLDALIAAGPSSVTARPFSSYPVAKEDVALIVAADVPAAEVEAALAEGAGELLESIRLFDVYTGEQIGDGKKSLAFALRFRAQDRTLKESEVAETRQAAVQVAVDRFAAVQRVG
ncbi:phenylalanyl-tRNA synthetase, beta subunit [Kribbella flavida DSM 17836]|uniref:Phenylalanine--tRNA ligase beta subunit n=1 Tax=Kribbella flavida (strain DSM 17836 / JCM 10339 / NBRC 14399) TaxID=479435 RepID=D2PM90_KRIFD|nr:phenylalanine--tRNA ligase subunit beta [Kribbella flavida]ADB34458.1 phenylalanyl-tRNA synthetase, beta subunit [Kribbella flavida DSM 17836]